MSCLVRADKHELKVLNARQESSLEVLSNKLEEEAAKAATQAAQALALLKASNEKVALKDSELRRASGQIGDLHRQLKQVGLGLFYG